MPASSRARNKNRRLRRLKSELKYFRSTLEEMSSVLGEYESEWASDSAKAVSIFSKSEEDHEDKDNSRRKLEIPAQEIPMPEPNSNIESKEHHTPPPPWAKDLFRKIARRTHPDAVQGVDMIDTFRKATEAMDNQNFDSLIDFAIDIGVDPGVGIKAFDERLKSRVKNAKNEIEKIETSIAWIWGESYGEEKIRVALLEGFLKSSGINAAKEEVGIFINQTLSQE